jgi:hypothetical protein
LRTFEILFDYSILDNLETGLNVVCWELLDFEGVPVLSTVLEEGVPYVDYFI